MPNLDYLHFSRLAPQNMGNRINHNGSDQAAKAAQGFEQVFLTQFLTISNEGINLPMVDEQAAGDIFKAWLLEAYAEIWSKDGSIGIAQQVERHINKKKEPNNE